MNEATFEEKKFALVLGFIIASVVMVFGMWNVDIGTSGMLMDVYFHSLDNNASVVCTNGWYSFSSMQGYHIGLYEITAGLFANIIMFCYCFVYMIDNKKL